MIDKEKALEALELTLEWLDNLEQRYGLTSLLDAMPNNWAGRFAIQSLMDEIEQETFTYQPIYSEFNDAWYADILLNGLFYDIGPFAESAEDAIEAAKREVSERQDGKES